MLTETDTTVGSAPELTTPNFDIKLQTWVLGLLVVLLILGALALVQHGHSSPGF